MKVLLLLSVLLLSAGTSKAQKLNASVSYYYGNVAGAGMVLCIMANKGELGKEIAKKWIEQWVQLFKQDPRIKNTKPAGDNYSAVDSAYKDLKEDPNCKGVI